MRRSLVLVMATALMAQTATPARSADLTLTAGEMFESCRPFRGVDFTREQLQLPSDFQTGVCWGTFLALYYASNMVDGSDRPLFHICPPQGTTAAQFVNVYLAYLEAHPDFYGEPFILSAGASLIKAFPCHGRTLTSDGRK